MTIDEKLVATVAQAIAAERIRQFGSAAGIEPRDVEFDYARAAILACESAKQKEAEGWVLVPREPSDEMLKPFGGRHAPNGGSNRAAYRAMLAAAPEPPSALLSAGGEG